MKATGIVRRIDDLGRVVIPKEIHRTMRIREGDPSHTTLTPLDRLCLSIHSMFLCYRIYCLKIFSVSGSAIILNKYLSPFLKTIYFIPAPLCL